MTHNDTDGNDSDGVECPTCGRTDFKNELGMKQHHARTHGESLIWVEKTCEFAAIHMK